jgi:hypothetical protein
MCDLTNLLSSAHFPCSKAVGAEADNAQVNTGEMWTAEAINIAVQTF